MDDVGEGEGERLMNAKNKCLKLGFIGIDVKDKKVALYDEGKGEFTAVCERFLKRHLTSGIFFF